MTTKILLVDDSMALRLQVKMAFKDYGYDILEAKDGVEAIEVIKVNSDLDLMICDINMPNMDGLDMLDALVTDSTITRVPMTIVLTTESAPELIDRAKKNGVKGWLIKPLKVDKLVSLVTKLLSSKS